jgi:hypothetical protein
MFWPRNVRTESHYMPSPRKIKTEHAGGSVLINLGLVAYGRDVAGTSQCG